MSNGGLRRHTTDAGSGADSNAVVATPTTPANDTCYPAIDVDEKPETTSVEAAVETVAAKRRGSSAKRDDEVSGIANEEDGATAAGSSKKPRREHSLREKEGRNQQPHQTENHDRYIAHSKSPSSEEARMSLKVLQEMVCIDVFK